MLFRIASKLLEYIRVDYIPILFVMGNSLAWQLPFFPSGIHMRFQLCEEPLCAHPNQLGNMEYVGTVVLLVVICWRDSILVGVVIVA